MTTFVVSTSTDSGPGSLRQAILDANRTAGNDEITFNLPTGAQSISLLSALPAISESVNFRNATGAANLTIQRAAQAPNFRIFSIQSGVSVQIEQLTLSNGNAGAERGGAIANRGVLTLTNSVVSGNRAQLGGGIWNGDNAVLFVNGTTVADNVATAETTIAFGGGGIENSGILRISNSAFLQNQALLEGVGGAISNLGGSVVVVNSTFSGNQAGGNGGAIRNGGSTNLINVTVVGNTSDANADGVGNGGGVINDALMTLHNSLIAGNFDTPNNSSSGFLAPDVSGNFSRASSANLIGDGSGSNLSDGQNGNRVGTSTNRIDPRLGPLTNNGGLTQTYLLLPDSPAIDAGMNDVIPPNVETDQRGAGFPRIVGDRVDIGAVEYRFVPIPGTLSFTSSTSSTIEGNAGSRDVVVNTVRRTGGTNGTVTVQVELVGGSATPGSDFIGGLPLTLTFAEGEALKNVTVSILGDRIGEAHENFTLRLVNPTGGATIGEPSTTTFTILNDDFPGILSFATPTSSVVEGNIGIVETPVATVERSGGSDGSVTVEVRLESTTATVGADFVNIFPLTLSFGDGETQKVVLLPIVGDTVVEPNEVLVLQLANPTDGSTIGNLSRTTVTIVNDDSGGTPNDDVLVGTPDPDVIDGQAGNDIIDGLAGDDVLTGGSDRGSVTVGVPSGTLGRATDYTNNEDPTNGRPAFIREWLDAAVSENVRLTGTNLAGLTTSYSPANPPPTLGFSPVTYANVSGLGVAGSFPDSRASIQAELNHNPGATGNQPSSEVLTMQWATDVSEVYINFSYFFSKETEDLGTEVGFVRAFNDGVEVDITGTRMNNRTTVSANQSSINNQALGVEFTADQGDGDFRLAVGGLFDTLVFAARAYKDDSQTAIPVDSSDYLIRQVAFQAAANQVTDLRFGDVLRGGMGNDTFRFGRGDGVDLVVDFAAGDRIQVRGYQSTDLILQGTTALFRNGSTFEAITSVGQASYTGSNGNLVQLTGNGRIWQTSDFVFV